MLNFPSRLCFTFFGCLLGISIYLLATSPLPERDPNADQRSRRGPARPHGQELDPKPQIPPPSKPEKWAYAFYAPSESYLCYALINADRLFNVLKMRMDIDVILIVNTRSGAKKVCTTQCFPAGRLKVFFTPEIGDAYDKSFGRFEAFGMTDYSRIILVDADGMIMKNLDHMFQLDLKGKTVAASISTSNGTTAYTTMLLSVDPSQHLLESISKFQNPEEVAKVLSDAENSQSPALAFSSDGDLVLNRMITEGLITARMLPTNYTAMESQFNEPDGSRRASEAYFVSYDNRPLDAPDGGRTVGDSALQRLREEEDGGGKRSDGIMSMFWQAYYKRCDGLMSGA